MRRKGNRRSPGKPLRQRPHCCVGHGAANFAFPQVDKDKIWQGLDLHGTQLIHQILCVQMQKLLWKRDSVCGPRFGACAIGIIETRNDLECPVLDRKVCMGQAQTLAHPHPCLIHKRQEKTIPLVGTGVEELLNLFTGQCLWLSLFSFERHHTCGFRFGLGDAMQEWLVPSAMGKGKLVQREFRNRCQAHMVGVEAVNRSQSQINRCIRSVGFVWCNRDDRRIEPAQPGNECCKLSNVHLFPTELLIAEVFPEQLQSVSRCANSIWAAIQVVEIFEVRKDRLHRDMVIIQDHLRHAIIGKMHSLYLHHLPPFLHPKLSTDIFYNEEPQRFLTFHCVRCE